MENKINLSRYLYNKIIEEKVNVSYNGSIQQVKAALYLVMNNKGTLTYYPYDRGRYKIEIPRKNSIFDDVFYFRII